MLDTSGSMTLALDLVKLAAEEFLHRLLPEDKAKVGAFNDKLEVKPEAGLPFTNNRDQLIRALGDLDFGYPTRLYDAIDYSMNELEPLDGRKVVLVFTDGEDTASRKDAGDVIDRARTNEIMVYSIGMENVYFNGQSRVRTSPDRGLRRVSDETGGGFFMLKKQEELGPTFTRVAQELHSQYVMGFSPEVNDGKVHKLEVEDQAAGHDGTCPPQLRRRCAVDAGWQTAITAAVVAAVPHKPHKSVTFPAKLLPPAGRLTLIGKDGQHV